MASEVQTLRPKDNMNLMNEPVVYDIMSTNNFHLHDFSNYGEQQDYNHYSHASPELTNMKFVDPNMNLTTSEMVNVPYNLMPPPPYKMVNYNNNITVANFDRRDNYRTRDNNQANSPKGSASDESCGSYSSKETPETKGTKCRHSPVDDHSLGQASDFCGRYSQDSVSVVYQPFLYRPNCNNKRAPAYGFGPSANRLRQTKHSDVMVRRAYGLMERFKSRANKMRIDSTPSDLLNGGPWDGLNQTIWDVFSTKIEKSETYINKLNLWKSIFLCIRKCLNSYGLFLVGSTMSGFGLDGSDVDMCLLTKPFNNDPRIDSLHNLSHLRQLLIRGGLASEAELIMAKVPILKFKNKETGFEVDLNCNNAVGIRNTHLLYCYSQLDWRVRPLVVIVKLWAQANHINDAKNMTISSYSWALMVIHFLQCGVTPPVLPCLHGLVPDKFNSDIENHSMDVQEDIDFVKNFESDNTSCLGDLLIGFFHYYSFFEYSLYAISVRTGARLPIDECRFLKMPKNDPGQWKYLCIEEPFDYTNTARSVFDPEIFRHIKTVIICSYKELARNKTLNYILPVSLHRQR